MEAAVSTASSSPRRTIASRSTSPRSIRSGADLERGDHGRDLGAHHGVMNADGGAPEIMGPFTVEAAPQDLGCSRPCDGAGVVAMLLAFLTPRRPRAGAGRLSLEAITSSSASPRAAARTSPRATSRRSWRNLEAAGDRRQPSGRGRTLAAGMVVRAATRRRDAALGFPAHAIGHPLFELS